MVQFCDLVFEPHPLGLPIRRARHNGYSIIYGVGIRRLEVMNPEGDTRSNLSKTQVEEIINQKF